MNNKLFPDSIGLIVFYDPELQRITDKKSEKIIVSKNMPFILLLSMLFKSYPEIEQRYPPGALGFLLNNQPPSDFDTLEDGDKVSLSAAFDTI